LLVTEQSAFRCQAAFDSNFTAGGFSAIAAGEPLIRQRLVTGKEAVIREFEAGF
jgi:hypothetical protein